MLQGCISKLKTGHHHATLALTEPSLASGVDIADGYSSRDRLSPEIYEESETDPGAEDISTRIFVALFDYDPLTMSPNPDAVEEELPFKEGQVIKVYGDKDVDGFYRGETCARLGLIPCNMVSEIQADDEEMMDQLLKQGFLPLNTPVEKLVKRLSDFSSIEEARQLASRIQTQLKSAVLRFSPEKKTYEN
uniref:RIMS-binding protein 2 n=1 Tax=Sphaerodactylus townsendi TaxID=933632 RepID=A0ACB8FZ48_9SAUR